MSKFSLSALTVAIAAAFVSLPANAKDFNLKPGDTGVNQGENVAYYKLNSPLELSNLDNITQSCIQGRIFWDKPNSKDPNQSLKSDLTLDNIRINHTNDGYHNGLIAFRGVTDSKYNVTVNNVYLGYNTALQVFDDMRDGQLTIKKVVVNSSMPEGSSVADYESKKEQFATQIEVWRPSDGTGKLGATMNIGELVVEDGRIVALTNRAVASAPGSYMKNTHLNIGKVTLNQNAKLRSGYSAAGSSSLSDNMTPTGLAWSSTELKEVQALGDATIEIDNGVFNVEKISVASEKTLTVQTNEKPISTDKRKTEALFAANDNNALAVSLDKSAVLNFNAKSATDLTLDVATLANAPGKVVLGANATLEGNSVSVTGLDSGASGNLNKDLASLAQVVQKDGKSVAGVEVIQEATDIFDGGSAITTANGGLSQVKVIANSNINGIAEMTAVGLHIWRNEINDMNKRLGELRDSSDDANGVWARVYNGKAKFGDQKITNKYTAFQFGYDRQVADSLWLGGALSWTDGDSDFAVGGGDNSLMALTAYGSKLWDNGMFVDVTGKFGRIKNEFDIRLANGRSNADYDANAVSVSAEAGWRVYPLNNSFFVEPQVEMMYGRVESVDYTTSTGVKVNQDSAETLIGRAGFVMGLKCPADRGNAYVRASVLHDWEGDANFKFTKDGVNSRAISESLGGTWYEYGIGANFNATKQLHVYADVEAANGGEVDTDYRVNLGMRYSF